MNDDDTSTDERLGPLLDYFGSRLNRIFAYYFCVLEFENDPEIRGDPISNSRAWVLRTIEDACLHETLMALRDLNDFLAPRGPATRADDLRAADFGYGKDCRFLSRSERESIHKLIAHITITGAAADGFRWGVWELTTKCVAQATEFLTWIEGEHLGFQLWTSAMYCRTQTQKVYAYVAGEISSRRAKKTEEEKS